MSEPGPPSGRDGSLIGTSNSEVDDFLAGLLTGELRVKVDPASGKILEINKVPLDSPTGEAYDRPG